MLVRDLEKPREYHGNIQFTDHPEEILQDPEIDIIVEVMGGIEPARTYIHEALRQGKNVVADLEHLEETLRQAYAREPPYPR
ncbi:MAG: hypothetical protein M1377_07350 [Deltaproteobacteria bacterium]|nr:hypothetical protein [Deltaproteobacteria bacterium]